MNNNYVKGIDVALEEIKLWSYSVAIFNVVFGYQNIN
jgi:hypothetical protein